MIRFAQPSDLPRKTLSVKKDFQLPTPGVGLDNHATHCTIRSMPTRKVLFQRDNFYHIFSRGNRKETIFFKDPDYQRFLSKTQEYKDKYGFDLVAYCLMPNHFHFLIKQLTEIPTSQFVGTLLNSYARYASIKYELPLGHVFQGRFGAKLLDSSPSLLQVSRYIHLNPIKDQLLQMDYTYKQSRIIKNKNLVLLLRRYPWSSYNFYLTGNKSATVTVSTKYIFEIENSSLSYRKFVESKITDEDILNIEDF